MRIEYFPEIPANPYTAMLYGGIAGGGHGVRCWTPLSLGGTPLITGPPPDVFHLHWIEAIAQGRFARRSGLARRIARARLLARLRAVRRRGGKVVWTVHNLAPHEDHAGTGSGSQAIAEALPLIDQVISLSGAAAGQIAARFPALAGRISVIDAPQYTVYPAGDAVRGRALLGVPAGARVLGIFGLIRPFKEIGRVIADFAAVKDEDVWLAIAGECLDNGLAAALRAQAAATPRVRLVLGRLDDQAFADAHAAADVIVLGQRTMLNSGAMMAALSLGRRVLAHSVGSLPEVAAAVGEGWMILRDRLDAAAMSAALALPEPAGAPDLSAYAVDAIAARHVALYRALLEG